MNRPISYTLSLAACLMLFSTTSAGAPLNSVFRLAAGGGHTCAMDTALNVFCWGRNDQGQLGIRSRADRSRPTVVAGIGNDINAIAAGGAHTCALTNGGQLFCWGSNSHGQIGDGTRFVRTIATAVGGLTTPTAVELGAFHTCALEVSGNVRCWGRNLEGQLGDGSQLDRFTAVSVTGLSGALDVAVGGFHSCAITPSRAVRCWGSNEFGQLGDGGSTDSNSAVDVPALGATAIALSAGLTHTCALLTGGTLKCWGRFIGAVPMDLGLLNVSKISAGAYHQCALNNIGEVRCIGWNGKGQLGDGSTTDRLVPVAVTSLGGGVSEISAGSAHTCAAMAVDGGLRCWGDNSDGQLGFAGGAQ